MANGKLPQAAAISRVAALGMKYYDSEQFMYSAAEQYTQFEGQTFYIVADNEFWRKGPNRTASIDDYTLVLRFDELAANMDRVEYTRGTLSQRPVAGSFGAKQGDLFFDYEGGDLYVSTGDRWIKALHDTTGIGEWSSQKDYSTNDIVVYNGNLYRNIGGNTPDKAPDDDNPNWVKITDNRNTTKYIDGVKYLKGQRVRVDGITYEAMIDTDTRPSPTSRDWQIVSDAINALPRYSPIQDYSKGDIISYDEVVYENVTGVNTGHTPNEDPTNWQLKFGSNLILPYDSEKEYEPGDTATWTNKVGQDITVIAVKRTSSDPDADPKSWDHFSDNDVAVPRYNPRNVYHPGDIINYRGVLYKSTYGNVDTTKTPDEDRLNWWRIENETYDVFQNDVEYNQNDIVYYNGEIYKYVLTHPSALATPNTPEDGFGFVPLFGDGQKRSVAVKYDTEQAYKQFDVVFDDSLMYYNKTGVNSGDKPGMDSDNWGVVKPTATGWDSDLFYYEGDKVSIGGVEYIKITGDDSGYPPEDNVNWEVTTKFDPGMYYFENAGEMNEYNFRIPGDLAYVRDTNSMWTFIGDWNDPKMRLLDSQYLAVDTSWAKLSVRFPADKFDSYESAKVMKPDGDVEGYFAYRGVWTTVDANYTSFATDGLKDRDMTDTPDVTVNVNRHTKSWAIDTLNDLSDLDKYPPGTTVNVIGKTRQLVEVENWDLTRRAGNDALPSRTSGPFVGDVKKPILTLESYPDMDFGQDMNLPSVIGRTLVSNNLNYDMFQGDVDTFPSLVGDNIINEAIRVSPLPTEYVYMGFPGVNGRWKIQASSVGPVFGTDETTDSKVTVNLTNNIGDKQDYTLDSGVAHSFTWAKDGALFYGCMEPHDSDQCVGEANPNGTGGNWYPDATETNGVFDDPNPTLTITRENAAESFYFFGLRGQFMRRAPEAHTGEWYDAFNEPTNIFNIPNVWGGWCEKIYVTTYLAGVVQESFEFSLLEDLVREYDPDNTNKTSFHYEGMHYIDLNGRSFHAVSNRNVAGTKEVREGILCDKVEITFQDWPDNAFGDPITHRELWGMNSFAPIVSTNGAEVIGSGTTITQQWLRTGEETYIGYEAELDYASAFSKMYEAYPYAPRKYDSNKKYGFPFFRE
ncbi:MAG: hypothetical protein N0C84_01155 [Candidatus Thiodiazotropha taylori]|uniref:Chitin-binding type-3 domain-containing protein n=1 Tax=Candidatus Thiodiazotropha taylori TaxID=2792791 RepID=A0A9E4N3K1_9GAMM|nr:hypothetical protein [Candidatus Thiodiazotropha taylori]MCW4255054.1 hypothetical protein [Candidatus Thiodiazotropha taylori]